MSALLSRAVLLVLALSPALHPTTPSGPPPAHVKAAPPGEGSLRIRVRDMRELPVPRAVVTVAGTPLRAPTDELGRARFDHVPAGPCTVRARLLEFEGRADGRIQPGKVTRLTVRLAYAAPRDTLPGTLIAPGSGANPPAASGPGEIDGDVVDGKGLPQPYAHVEVLGTPRGVPTDPAGHFRITRVPSGDWSVRVQAVDAPPCTVQVHVGAWAQEFVHVVVGRRLPAKSSEPPSPTLPSRRQDHPPH